MNYTTIEQSKKLLELGLNSESADMFYSHKTVFIKFGPTYSVESDNDWHLHRRSEIVFMDTDNEIPCWSLGALLELMPKKIKKDYEKLPFHLFQFKDTWGVQYGYPNETEYAVLIENKTPLEAAYNMVVWLLENNYIKKEGNT